LTHKKLLADENDLSGERAAGAAADAGQRTDETKTDTNRSNAS
jgi:hypothetical protein